MTGPPPSGEFGPPPSGYPPPYGYGYPPPRGTNGLAVAALVCAFLFAPLGIVFGHMSLYQIKKTGEEGRGLAIAGLVIGYLITTVTVMVIVVSVLFVLLFASALEDVDLYPDSPSYTVAPPAELPAFDPPATLGSNCQYPRPPSSAPASPWNRRAWVG